MSRARVGCIRAPKYLAAARGQACVNCGVQDDTVVAAHYQGMRAHSFGKGIGNKPHDILVADLCIGCHSKFDAYANTTTAEGENRLQRRIDRSEQFLYLIAKTIIRRIESGVIEVR